MDNSIQKNSALYFKIKGRNVVMLEMFLVKATRDSAN